MVDTLKQAGWKVAIASGGFTRFAGELQRELGLDAIFANELAVEGQQLTGKVSGPIVDAAVKAEALQQLASEYGVAAGQTVAVGDGANDLKMMGVAGLGIAIHAKPLVRAQAAATSITTIWKGCSACSAPWLVATDAGADRSRTSRDGTVTAIPVCPLR
jgi:phosphoserine phosphatase